MKDIIGKISNSKDLFEELFIAFSYLFGGIFVAFSILYVYGGLNIEKLTNLIMNIYIYGQNIPLFLLSVIFLYALGNISVLIFDLVIYSLGTLSKYARNLKFIGWIFKRIYDFLLIKYPLHSEQEKLGSQYKASVAEIISKYFDMTMNSADANRLCKQLCVQNRLIKLYKVNHFFILNKALFTSLLLMFGKLVEQNFYIIAVFCLFLLVFILIEIRDATLNTKINYIDGSVVYIKTHNKKN